MKQSISLDLLQLAFIVLKLCGVIKWSWLWVLSPMWITTILVLIYIAILVNNRWYEKKDKARMESEDKG